MTDIGVSAVTAYTAHREWARRPPDERFASVEALWDTARARRTRTEERDIATVDLRTEAVATDALALHEASGRSAAMTHWSFEQLATIAGAPPKYLRTLPAMIAKFSAEISGLQARLSDSAFYARDPDGFVKLSLRLSEAQRELAAAEERWLELEMRRENFERPR